MKFLKVSLFLLIGSMTIAPAHSEEEKKITPSDYIGVSLDVPKETQKLIDLKMEKVGSTETAEKIPVAGRISQDPMDVVEVMASESGILKEQLADVGSAVAKDQVIAKLDTGSNNEIEIKAPVSGMIIANFSKTKENVDTTSPIYTIADLTKLSANFDVYEKDLAKIKVNQTVSVYSNAYPDQSFDGKIVFISPRVDEASYTIKIRVQIDNPKYLLKLGMFVRGEIMVQDHEAHLVVPADSVQSLGGTDVVFVQDEEGSFTPTEVKVSFSGHKQATIRGDLKAGDIVVAGGAYILKSKILEGEISGGCDD